MRSAKDWSDQTPPTLEFPPGVAPMPAAAGPGDSIPGGEPSPMLVTGGFRWEYDDSITELDTHFAQNLKLRYNAMLQEIVPAGVDIDDHIPTGPVGRSTVRRAPGIELEQETRPSTEADIRGIEQQIEV
jgi:hypothetical protein